MTASEVIVYVEGPSDKRAMEALLRPLIQQKLQDGLAIYFFESPEGNKKESLLIKIPRKAANIVHNNPHSVVVAMPDLYPKDEGFKHETFDELRSGILKRFNRAWRDSRFEDDVRLRSRFKVFCFKYDLEALVLAAEKALKDQLDVDHLEVTWRIPVENQDHEYPPKRVVQRLFKEHRKRYKATIHARSILEKSDYRELADKCPQCFKPFVEFLSDLEPVTYHFPDILL